MSTGTPSNPVCTNTTAALIASPTGVRAATGVVDPVCRTVTPTTGSQTAAPDAPPAGR